MASECQLLEFFNIEEHLETFKASKARTVILSYAIRGNTKAGDKTSLF